LGGFGRVREDLQKTVAGNKNSGNRNPPKNKTPIEKEKKILSALKEGKGIRETAALIGVAHGTVERIRYENADDLPSWRKKTVENLTRVHDKLVNQLENSIEKLPVASIPIGIGILSDKINQHSGFSAQVVEHKHLHIDHSAVNGLLSDNKSEGKAEKQRETGPGKTQRDTKGTVIDLEPASQNESANRDTNRGGGGQEDSAALDT
jgi:hypothetical protein